MNLALVTHNVIKSDGQGRVNYQIASHALQKGVCVSLLADQVEPDLLERGAQWVRVRPGAQRLHLVKGLDFAVRASRTLERLGDKINVVHANGHTLNRPHHVNASHFVHGAWKRSPAHIARVRRDMYGAYQWANTSINAIMERQAYGQAQTIVAVSSQVRRELGEVGIAHPDVRVIHNGVDLESFRPGSVDRRALGLPADGPLALFVGDIRTPRKNLDTILKAMKKVPGLHLAVVGATENSPYPQMVSRLELTGQVRFLGFRRDVPEIMRAADLFVFPSRYEACSLVLLEALASGLPVVTAVTAGGAELVTPACGVVLPDPNDVSALTTALTTLCDDPARRTNMSGSARAVAEQHSWATMADAYLNLYAEKL